MVGLWGGALCAAARVWYIGHHILLGTGWHELMGAVIGAAVVVSNLTHVSPDTAEGSAGGNHPASTGTQD